MQDTNSIILLFYLLLLLAGGTRHGTLSRSLWFPLRPDCARCTILGLRFAVLFPEIWLQRRSWTKPWRRQCPPHLRTTSSGCVVRMDMSVLGRGRGRHCWGPHHFCSAHRGTSPLHPGRAVTCLLQWCLSFCNIVFIIRYSNTVYVIQEHCIHHPITMNWSVCTIASVTMESTHSVQFTKLYHKNVSIF